MPYVRDTLAIQDANIVFGEGCRISPDAWLGAGTQIADHVRIDADVVIGENNVISHGAVIKSGTRIGDRNQIGEYCILGGTPLIARPTQKPGQLQIGHDNVIREFATFQVGTGPSDVTHFGSYNYIMPNVQIGHDSQVGSHITMTNQTALCGHVTVEDKVVLGLGVHIHQHCRIGTLAMVGASAYVSQDIVPFTLVDGRTGNVVSLNKIGLSRHQIPAATISQLKQAFRVIFREGLSREAIYDRLQGVDVPQVQQMLAFLKASRRGYEKARRSSSASKATAAEGLIELTIYRGDAA
ncbi:acyl-ACP--UDP-N-acetylglucosamine O-acyltransferase [Bremerella cremea]|uniref:acyl-ACP--UDP-N-acetylglucosamine O-acyltransferase n=1 Tax=Bremerella cremea TaxID=1031537 RepID=UPI0031EB986B